MRDNQDFSIIDKIENVSLENEIGKFMISSYKLINLENQVFETEVIYSGDIKNGLNLRINSACFTSDIFGCRRCDCHAQLLEALKYIQLHEGMIIYLMNHEGRGVGITNKLKTLKSMDTYDWSTYQAFVKHGFPADNREYGQAVCILRYFGISEVKLITNNPDKKAHLVDNGIDVCDVVPLVIKDKEVRKYLLTKEKEFNHKISWYLD